MAEPAYRFIDRRGNANAYSSNLLIPSATQNKDRENIPRLDYDVHRNVSSLGRRILLSAGRRLFAGNSTVRAAIVEQATYAVSTFQAQYAGRNAEWGNLAEAWLVDNDKFCDLRGPPYNMGILRRNLIISVLRDGDVGILLTEDSTGAPKLQVIPSHRIGPWNQYNQFVVEGGEYDGARCIDGVIVDDYGRAMAYRVMGENPYDAATFTDISARSMILAFLPEYPDQVRGFSVTGASQFSWQDTAETEYHERLAHKLGSRIYLIEKNPTGSLDRTKQLLQDLSKAPGDNQTAQALTQEVIDDGMIRYLKAGTGSGLEAFVQDRPSEAAMHFFERQTRQSLAGMGWSYDFTLDPSGVGGAEMRIVIEKIMRTVEALRALVASPTIHRVDGYRVAKGIKNEFLPEDVDWWRWDYQGPEDLTADRKYDSDIDIQEYRAGLTTLKRGAARRGSAWMPDRIQKDIEVDDLLTRAKAKAEKFGMTIQEVIPLLCDVATATTLSESIQTALPAGQQPKATPPPKDKTK